MGKTVHKDERKGSKWVMRSQMRQAKERVVSRLLDDEPPQLNKREWELKKYLKRV